LSFTQKGASRTLQDVTRIVGENNINLKNVAVSEATLEDMFLTMTAKDCVNRTC